MSSSLEQIDEILQSLVNGTISQEKINAVIKNGGGVASFVTGQNSNKEIVKQQLLALIKEECRLARLDEISSIELEYAGHIVTTCIHGVAKSISDRYVELSEQKVNK